MRKNIFIVTVFSILFSTSVFASQFCDGFGQGYKTGYKQASGSGFDPFIPFCPFQPFKGFNDPKSDYEHGYIIGLSQGMAKGSGR